MTVDTVLYQIFWPSCYLGVNLCRSLLVSDHHRYIFSRHGIVRDCGENIFMYYFYFTTDAMNLRCILFTVMMTSLLPEVTWSYGTGPPIDEIPELCETMFPSGHNVSAKPGPSPYKYTIYSLGNCYGKDNTALYGR